MILIVSSADDWHAVRVAGELSGSGIDVRILDLRRFGNDASLVFDAADCGGHRICFASEPGIALGDVCSVWYRRALPIRAHGDIQFLEERRFAINEWREALSGLLLSLDATFVNSLIHQAHAYKPRQLHIAKRLGLRIPDTIITSDKGAARAFVEKHDGAVIHKALTAPASRFLETRRWRSRDADHLCDLSVSPAIFQEEITGRHELRITIVGDDIFAARIEAIETDGAVDSRLNIDGECRPYALPGDVELKLFSLMRELGLTFSTIDMRIGADGEYYFLELNPQGQFLYIEILTGLPITQAMVGLLARKFPARR